MSTTHSTLHPARLGALAGALLCAVTLAACGGDDPKDAKTGAAAAYDGALKFAKCMREHGVDTPDPKQGPNGELAISATRVAPVGSAKADDLEQASKACQKFLGKPGGPARDPEQEAKQRDAFLAYATCMRGKGIDMPDPQVGGGRVTMQLGKPGTSRTASGPDPRSAQFREADRGCRGKLGDAMPGFATDAVGSAPATP